MNSYSPIFAQKSKNFVIVHNKTVVSVAPAYHYYNILKYWDVALCGLKDH